MSLKNTHNGRATFRPAFCRQEGCAARAEDPFCALCGADIGAYLDAVGGGPAEGPGPELPTPVASTSPTASSARGDTAATRELPVLVLPPHIGGGASNGNGNGSSNGNGHAGRPSDHHEDEPGPDRSLRIALLSGGVVGAAMGVAGALALGLL